MAEKTKKAQIFKRDNTWWSKNWFYTILIAVAVIGGVCAFWVVPFVVPQPFSKDDSISTLRQAVLVATGGFLAILTLWENRRKNDQEHMRQVHAERRARYAKAIEQLADEKAPIRLGGVYTLVKLVDDWLADEKTLPDEEERREEGQVIINSLCAYIRSSFDLASKAEMLSQDKTLEDYEGGTQQFAKDQARFREEKELRLTIIEAIRNRLNGGFITQEDDTKKLLKGSWSNFDYDFSNAHFFYPVNFAYSYFGTSLKFTGAVFTEAVTIPSSSFPVVFDGTIFVWVVFAGATDFSEAVFVKGAHFYWTTFTENANFSKVTFTRETDFRWASFRQSTDFSGSKFTQNAVFFQATFEGKPIFERALGDKTCKARFSCKADPKGYNFEVSDNSHYKIETEEKEYNETKFIIPKGTELFDPDEPSEQGNNDGS